MGTDSLVGNIVTVDFYSYLDKSYKPHWLHYSVIEANHLEFQETPWHLNTVLHH